MEKSLIQNAQHWLGGESARSGAAPGRGWDASLYIPTRFAFSGRHFSSTWPIEPETLRAPNLPPLIDSALVLRSQVRGRGATGSRLNENGGGNVRADRVVVEAHNNADPQVPRQDHSGLCRGAGDLRRQYGLLLFWLRAGRVRGRVLPHQCHRGRSRP